MSDHQVVLTLRVSERLLERLQTIADRPHGARSRSEAARQALELGLERLELEAPGSGVSAVQREVSLQEEVDALKARIVRIEQALHGGSI